MKTYTGFKSWTLGSLSSIEEDRERRVAASFSVTGAVDFYSSSRSFVHSSPTHREIRVEVPRKNLKKAQAAGFKFYGVR